MLIAVISVSALLALFVYLFIRKSIQYRRLHNRFKDVIDVEHELASVNDALSTAKEKHDQFLDQSQKQTDEIKEL